jgi:Na+/H+ antiporter NhaD/arsenite permease-like protein
LLAHLGDEWVIIANLFGLLLGFALLSKHFEASRVPDWLPNLLPDDWKGGLVLLVMIFVLSSFLDNIAAALIGGTIARVFRGCTSAISPPSSPRRTPAARGASSAIRRRP